MQGERERELTASHVDDQRGAFRREGDVQQAGTGFRTANDHLGRILEGATAALGIERRPALSQDQERRALWGEDTS